MVIPNSVLNTAALTKLTPVSEGMATLEFTAKASGDPSAISQDILDRVTKATADVALEGHRLLPLRHDRPSACVRARGCAAFHHQRYGGASHRRFGHRIPC